MAMSYKLPDEGHTLLHNDRTYHSVGYGSPCLEKFRNEHCFNLYAFGDNNGFVSQWSGILKTRRYYVDASEYNRFKANLLELGVKSKDTPFEVTLKEQYDTLTREKKQQLYEIFPEILPKPYPTINDNKLCAAIVSSNDHYLAATHICESVSTSFLNVRNSGVYAKRGFYLSCSTRGNWKIANDRGTQVLIVDAD
jgi:hypothetical protein